MRRQIRKAESPTRLKRGLNKIKALRQGVVDVPQQSLLCKTVKKRRFRIFRSSDKVALPKEADSKQAGTTRKSVATMQQAAFCTRRAAVALAGV